MRTITVSVPDELGEQLDARVQAHGGDESQYLREVLERHLRTAAPDPSMTFKELLAMASGPSPVDSMSDEELTRFAEAEVKACRAKRQARVVRG